MKPSLWHRMDVLARHLTPFGLTLILLVVGIVPWHVPGLVRVVPLLPLMAVYHWAVFRPELMPSYAVFLVGLLHDTLTGTPIGVHAMVYLVVYGLVLSQRRFLVGKSFAIIWLGFGLVAAGASVLSWVLVSAYNVTLVEPRAVLYQYLVTLGVYPMLAWLFMRWQQTFLRQE